MADTRFLSDKELAAMREESRSCDHTCDHAYQGGSFCDKCGAKLSVLICPKCGMRSVNKDAKFCFVCGAKLD